MAILHFTPPTVSGPFDSTTEGLYSIPFNWSPQQAPVSGDTAIVNYGTLDTINTTISGVSIFSISVVGKPNPALSLQSTLLRAGATLVIDSRALGVSIPITATFNFENDGTIDILGQATLSAFAGSASIVNKGALNLYDGFLVTSVPIENDGVVTVNNSSPTIFASSITGAGSIVLKPGSKIETTSAVSSSQIFKFTGGSHGNSSLQVDSPADFRSPISGFSVSDNIILKTASTTVTGISYTTTGSNGGTLQISSGGTVASLNFVGSYGISDFTVSGTTGGLMVTTFRSNQGIADSSPVYRFFDTSNGTHFFTSSAAERDQVVNGSVNLVYEGVGLTATDPNGSSATPVYRFFDTQYGTHFYTASASERDSVVATRSDLKFEGVGFYGDATQQSGDSAVYRFFDSQFGTHFYTASGTEAASIQANRTDLKYEGVSFYSAS